MQYRPLLAKLGKLKDLNRKDWIFEIKSDGIRTLVHINSKTIFYNRLYKDIKKRYPEINIKVKKSCVLDAEIVCFKDKKSEFSFIEKREKTRNIKELSKKFPATLIVFDILELDGKDITKKSLKERKKLLKRNILKNKSVIISKEYLDGKKLWEKVVKDKLEGVVAKKISSNYQQGRSKNWLKVMNQNTMDVIISNNNLKVYHKGKLKIIGKVKSKINNKVIEVSYEKFDKKLINPKILNIRTDKLAKDCILEEQI